MLSLMCSIWSFKETHHRVYFSIVSKSHCRNCLFLNINCMKKIENYLLCFQIYIILQATNHYFWNIYFLMKKLIMVFLMLKFVVFKTWPVSRIHPWKVKWTKNWTLFLIIISYKSPDYIDALDRYLEFLKSSFLPNWECSH